MADGDAMHPNAIFKVNSTVGKASCDDMYFVTHLGQFGRLVLSESRNAAQKIRRVVFAQKHDGLLNFFRFNRRKLLERRSMGVQQVLGDQFRRLQ
ncbi:hypothetical protein D3C77_495430 [compost metagenome]